MINYFPNAFPDEIFCSIIGRYHRDSGNKYIRQTSKDLFDSENKTNSIDFPTKLGIIAKKIGDKRFVDDMVFNHTLYPLFLPFMSKYEQDAVIELVRAEEWNSSYLNIRHMTPYRLKYCPLCYKQDIETFNDAYFHRIHQIPYIKICSKHKCELYELQHNKAKDFNYVWLHDDNVNSDVILFNRAKESHKLSLEIEEVVNILLNDDYTFINREKFKEYFFKQLSYKQWFMKDINYKYIYINQTLEKLMLDTSLDNVIMQSDGYNDFFYNEMYTDAVKMIMTLNTIQKGSVKPLLNTILMEMLNK